MFWRKLPLMQSLWFIRVSYCVRDNQNFMFVEISLSQVSNAPIAKPKGFNPYKERKGMQVLSGKPKDVLSSGNGDRRISLGKTKEDNVINIIHEEQSEFRVMIVDRDSMGSDILAKVLASHSGCDALAIPSTNLLRALSENDVDLIVVGSDLNGEVGSGFELAAEVSRAHPNIGIVILLNRSTRESVINAFRSGALGVFSRQQPMTEFLACVANVRKGLIWAGREETNSLLKAFKNIPAPNLVISNDSPALTARELEVVQCAAEGKTNRGIAKELGVSEHTVKNHLFRAFEKLGVSSRVELLFYLTLRGHTFNPTKADDGGLS
jgi:two-component system, NarL family, nitrate/nitrite response regulator NarL